MPEEIDWVQSLDRLTTVLVRHFMVYRALEKTTEDEVRKKAAHEQFKRNIHFLTRRLADPEFSRFIDAKLDYTRKGSKKRGQVVEKNMRLLARFILEDMAKKTKKQFATTADILPHLEPQTILTDGSGNGPKGDRSYGRFHEIVEEFPELAFTRPEVEHALKGRKFDAYSGRRVADRRERVIWTPYTRDQKWPPETFLYILAMVKDRWRGEEAKDYLFRAVTQIADTQKIEVTDLVTLRKARRFETYAERTMSELGLTPSFEHSPGGAARRRHFVHFASGLLFNQTRTLAELHWFLRLSRDKQNKLIFREPAPLEPISQKKALACVKELREWLGSDHDVMFVVQVAGEPLLFMGQTTTAERLLKAALEELELSRVDEANALHSLAMIHRVKRASSSMKEALEEALRLWQEEGRHPGDQAIEYAYLAELALEAGDTRAYDSLKGKAEALAMNEELTITRQANVLLYLADCAELYKDVSWELKLLEKGELVAMKEKELTGHFEYLEQCIGDLTLSGRRGSEWGEGRVRRPPQYRSEPMSGLFEVMLDDPDFGN